MLKNKRDEENIKTFPFKTAISQKTPKKTEYQFNVMTFKMI